MRVLLIQSPSVEGMAQEKVYPIGIVSLAGYLKKARHEIAILDMNLESNPFGALREKLLDFEPGAVCISLRNIDPLGNKTASLVPHFSVVVRMAVAVRPGAWIIAGGTGFSLFPERLMRELPEIHYGIIGEAEQSLPALLSSLDNPPPLKGLCMRKGDKIRTTAPSRAFDMAGYRPPDRRLLDPSRYLDINSYVPAIGIETKRGCPFACAYCVYPRLQGKKMRCRPAKSVADEMEALHKEYGIGRFHFTDPVANIPNGHLEEICGEIIRRKLEIKWDGFMREDHLSEKNASLFVQAGCECFSFSPDGLCRESLKVLGKGLREADILRAARIAAGTEALSVYHFMVNVPGETEETCEKGIRMLERIYDLHSVKRNLGTVVLNNIRILPGTRIAERALEEKVITEKTDLLYPVYFNPPPFDSLRYRLETMHFQKNVFMWQGIR